MVDNYSVKIILEELYSKIRANIKPGLERTYQLLEFLGNPQKEFESIHIAGTNGKGAVSSTLASILIESEKKTGLYVSPHLFKFNERISINGEFISDEEIVAFYNLIKPTAENIEATFFELTTAMAFYFFAKNSVEIAVIETGLGGRLDSTNVLEPIASCITSIGMDHSDFLGDTIEQIASEKAGIIKEKKAVYISGNIPSSALDVIENKAKKEEADLKLIENIFDSNYNSNFTSTINIDGKNFINYLPGKNQTGNFLLAYNIAKDIFQLPDKIIQGGIEKIFDNTGYFGRISILQNKPLIILDISHNLQAIRNLTTTLDLHRPNKKYNVLFTIMDDKNYQEIIDELNKIAKQIIITKSSSSRNIDIEFLADHCKKNKIFHRIIEDPNLAFEELIKTKQDFIITGSFYLASDLKNKIITYQINKNLL